jgi:uncharacterized protein
MDLAAHFRAARTIAVVGCSPRPSQTSHAIARYLQGAGYTVIPVNPHREELLGVRCYPDLLSIPEDTKVDIVNVFRRPEFTPDVVRDAADRAERTGQHPLIWTQLGVHNPEAQRLAEEAGLPYLANRCIMIDHQMLAY